MKERGEESIRSPECECEQSGSEWARTDGEQSGMGEGVRVREAGRE